MAGRKRKRLRRWLGLSLLGVLGFLALLLVLGLAFRRPLLRRFALPALEKEAGEVLGLTVTVEDGDLELPGKLILRGVRAAGPSPRTGLREASIPRAEISFSLLGLIRGEAGWLESVVVDGPRLDLDLDHKPLVPPGGAAAEAPPPPGPPRLPAVRIAGGEIRASGGGEALALHGVDLDLSPPDVRLQVAGAEGDWTRPRIGALRFPLEAEARLVSGPGALTGVDVERLVLAGQTFAEGVSVDLSAPGGVRIEGRLPGAGIAVRECGIGPECLEAHAHLQDSEVGRIMEFFLGGDLPRGSATGDVRLSIPLHGGKDWSVDGELEVSKARWETADLSAELITVEAHPAEGSPVEGTVLIQSLTRGSSQPFDLEGNVRHEALPDGERRILVDETVLYRGKAVASAGGVLREGELRVEPATLAVTGLPVSALEGLVPGLEGFEGTVDAGASFVGKLEDLSTVLGSARLTVEGFRAAGGTEAAMSLAISLNFADLTASVEEGVWRSGRDEVRFALSSSFEELREISFGRLDGTLFDLPFEAVHPPSIRIADSRFRIEPSRLRLLKGGLDFQVRGSLSGELDLYLRAEGLDISGPLGALLRGMDPRGAFSTEVEVSTAAGGIPTRLGCRFSLEEGALTVEGRRLEGVAVRGWISGEGASVRIEELEVTRGPDRATLSATLPVVFTPLPVLEGRAPSEASFLVDVKEVAGLPIPPGQLREVGGRVVAAGELWSPGAPDGRPGGSIELDAAVNLFDGTLKLFGDIPSLTAIQAELHVKGDAVTVRELKGKIRGSDFKVTGAAKVSPPWDPRGPGIRELDLALSSKELQVFQSPDLRVRGDVDLRWSGPWEAATLSGTMRITRAYYLKDISIAPQGGPKLPLQLFSIAEPPLSSLRFNIHALSDREINIRNNLVSTRASADITLGGTGLEPVLLGTVSTDEGTVNFNDSKLKVRSALIELLRTDPLNPRLQIVLGDTLRGYDVSVTITGTLQDPEMTLESSPPLERERLLLLISTGLTMEEVEGQGVGKVAAVEAAKYMGRKILRYFSSKDVSEDTSFLGRFSVETESARSAQYQDPLRVDFTLGKDVLLKKDEVFLQGERDTYGDYNFNLGISFEVK